MKDIIQIFEKIKKTAQSYWTERIISQIGYAIKLSSEKEDVFDGIIKETLVFLEKKIHDEGTITNRSAIEAEKLLSVISEEAKSLKVICAAHAHIDMNWLWGYAETVAVVLETFRTMLDMMNEYPQFIFSQSQASVYKIVEEYDAGLLDEIKRRVKEGRWEITASAWVEADKNMPNGESHARHILYSREYLSGLFDIDPDSLDIDFEPDTFGHNINMPEILYKGGVRYYYHCRGYEGYNAYNWQSPSGKSILVYREPDWYNSRIDPSMALPVPGLCSDFGVDTALKVYGVGDHGGGPTRKDIEKILDMGKWPVFPEISFGTFGQFFRKLESVRNKLPTVKDELNFIFPGCYTTQTRLKKANRVSEAKMYEAEAFSTISKLFMNGGCDPYMLKSAWEKILFSHFHDILTGSGIIDTREYSMGEFQKVLAAANTVTGNALRNIASRLDTCSLRAPEEDISGSRSEGAGVGYAIKDFGVPQAERGRGKVRILHFFNPSTHDRNETVEAIVWDWPGDTARITIHDPFGNETGYQLIEEKTNKNIGDQYWGHDFIRLLIGVSVPASGYSTYTLSENEENSRLVYLPDDLRVEKEPGYILENDKVRITLDSRTLAAISYIDKATGREMIAAGRPAGFFRLTEEDDIRTMTAWVVGRHVNTYDLTDNVRIRDRATGSGLLRQQISFETVFRNSRLTVKISLDADSGFLNYDVECDWQERSKKGSYIPQLNFYVPVAYHCGSYLYDIPFGTIERKGMDIDVPANSFVLGIPEKGSSAAMLATDSKYGFRCLDDSLSVTLIRSSYDPDPYPDNGIHKFRISWGAIGYTDNRTPIRYAFDFSHPIRFISGTPHKGDLPLSGSFLSVDSGNIAVSSFKTPEKDEDGNKAIIRLYETEGKSAEFVLRFARKIIKAYYTDINEQPLNESSTIETEGNTIRSKISPRSTETLCVEF